MEQVFGLVNVVLQRDRQTRKRTLSVRDYKVVPLRDWLTHAHLKYVFSLELLLPICLRC